ncbi:uncharacterized protein DS421_16g568040 [Arachis hypogaea]|nr:uncharacterized protein DS421_16g568040 [Arachis hypogaea]
MYMILLPSKIIKPGSKLETDRILKLVPEWPKSVQDWSFLILIEPLVGKIFENLSNATVVKLLIYICEDLANVADLVLHHVMLHVREQTDGTAQDM